MQNIKSDFHVALTISLQLLGLLMFGFFINGTAEAYIAGILGLMWFSVSIELNQLKRQLNEHFNKT